MIDQERFNEVLESFKQSFAWRWSTDGHDEQYKWKAVKHFQDNWDINAHDFAEMLRESIAPAYTKNLLASSGRFPGGMMSIYAQAAPEEVRAMYIALFDEGEDVVKRISDFKASAEHLHELYGEPGKNHFQDENSITTYLWLRYPDKHYIYKYSLARSTNNYLHAGHTIKKGYVAENVRNGIALDREINELLKADPDIRKLLQDQLTPDCYDDPELCTVTLDFEFFTYHYAKDKAFPWDSEWFPSKEMYDPEITVEQWAALLEDKSVFTENSLLIMSRLLDCGGAATCKQLSDRYGESISFYNSGSVALARRVAEKTGCPVMDKDSKNSKWWPVLYVGRYAEKAELGNYIWRLREELAEALGSAALPAADCASGKEGVEPNCNYWWVTAKPSYWSWDSIAVNETVDYTAYNDSGNKRRIFKYFEKAKPGDLVVGYHSTPELKVACFGKVESGLDGEPADCILIRKTRLPEHDLTYGEMKNDPVLCEMEYISGNPTGTIFKLSEEEYERIVDLTCDSACVKSDYDPYGKDEFLQEVYMTENRYDHLVAVLQNKKNIILQGAPGVGKTFAARRLAWSMMEAKDDSRIEFVQFHQSYSYEDFVMGYKPDGDTFSLKHGVFYRFCQKAANQPDKEFFFIIDEINRGNMSKIFGELLMLIENDYRGKKATLAYNGLPFSVPENLYIIGMMNTADRSLAMIDYALRRRFSFFEMEPGFDAEGFGSYQKSLGDETLDELVERVKELNSEIAHDRTLGKGFCIGHSYFCGQSECTDEWLHEVVEYDLLPMLSEYWFDDTAKLTRWKNILRGVLA